MLRKILISKGPKTRRRHKLFVNTVFAKRPAFIITCPGCGTEQCREHDFCCSCSIDFYFLDETNRYCI